MIPTYAIEAAPVYVILEYYMLGCLKNKSDSYKYNSQTVLRISIYILSVAFALCLYHSVQVFISLLGAICCAPLAITMPALIHYKSLATKRKEKAIDIFFMVTSLGVLTLSTYQSIASIKAPKKVHH